MLTFSFSIKWVARSTSPISFVASEDHSCKTVVGFCGCRKLTIPFGLLYVKAKQAMKSCQIHTLAYTAEVACYHETC